MGILLFFVRLVANPILGLAISLGIMLVILDSNLSEKLFNAEFYNSTIAGEDTYNRIYNEVLVDEEIASITQDLLGDIQVVSHDDIVGLLKQIMPPEYLQSQVEGAIQGSVDYLNHEVETLELFLELGPPLDRIKPTLFGYIDSRIDALPEDEAGPPECTPERISQVAQRFLEVFTGLAGGQVPESLPSIKGISQPCRVVIFEVIFDDAIAGSPLGPRVKQSLADSRDDIRAEFVDGDTHGVLKQAVRPLVTPLMDDAIEQRRAGLDDKSRLNLIQKLAEMDPQNTEEDYRAKIEEVRGWVTRARSFIDRWALVLVVAGVALMALLQFPSLPNALRRPGFALFLSGAGYFVIGKILEFQLPGRLRSILETSLNQVPGVPPSLVSLASDLVFSFQRQLTEGLSEPALTVLVIGAAMIGASFLVRLLKPLVPVLRATQSGVFFIARAGLSSLRRLPTGGGRETPLPQPATEAPTTPDAGLSPDEDTSPITGPPPDEDTPRDAEPPPDEDTPRDAEPPPDEDTPPIAGPPLDEDTQRDAGPPPDEDTPPIAGPPPDEDTPPVA